MLQISNALYNYSRDVAWATRCNKSPYEYRSSCFSETYHESKNTKSFATKLS